MGIGSDTGRIRWLLLVGDAGFAGVAVVDVKSLDESRLCLMRMRSKE